MNKFEKFAEIMGVEINEEFMLGDSSNQKIRITKNGVEYEKHGEWLPSGISLNPFLERKVIGLPFVPKHGEKYWYLCVFLKKGYSCFKNTGSSEDRGILKRITVYRTEEEVKALVAKLDAKGKWFDEEL